MSTRKALAFSFLDRYSGLILSIVSSMMIARLLSPAEVGVFSVAMVMLGYLSSLRDFGAGQYLLQEKQLTNDRVRATWTVQLGLGIAFSLIVFVASGPVAGFYNEPRMRDIMHVLALNFAISPFGSLTYAWLMREMRFESLAVMRFCGTLCGACTSVGLAWWGWGPISLAYGSLVATVVNALIAIRFRPATFPWLPGFTEVRRVLSFGGKITMTTVINTVAGSTAELVLGKVHGMAATGMYSRAQGLAAMFHRLVMDATNSVALPMFAKQAREQTSPVESFLRATAYITAIGWAFFLGMFFLAHPVIRLLYGDQWDGAVNVVRLLAMASMISLPAAMCSVAMTGSGAIRAVVQVTVINAIHYITCVALGASLGLLQVGLGLIATNAIGMCVWLHFAKRTLRFPWVGLFRTLFRSACVAAAAAIFPLCAFVWFGPRPESILAPLALAIPGSIVLFVFALYAFHHPLCTEVQRVHERLKAFVAR
jgi:O-antigen/teichoic acid export membrane protein